MTKHGKSYEAETILDNGRKAKQTRRAVYITPGAPTPEQAKAIERVERIVGDADAKEDPYEAMRRAEYLGVEIAEEYRCPSGWMRMPNPDIPLTTMQSGAL